MTRIRHTIIGLPRSGKTTFLAALWYVINAGEVQTALALDELAGDHTHLNNIAEVWMRCKEVPRTSLASETSVMVHVRERDTGLRAVVEFPDLSGESFDRQVAVRSCATTYVEGFHGEGGILLFVTADRSMDDLTIAELNRALEGDPNVEDQGELREWTPSLVPAQVRLVELLQFLQRPPFQHTRRRLGVIVSAWV